MSLTGMSDNFLWQAVLRRHLFFIPAIPLVLFLMGAYSGFRTRNRPGRIITFFEIATAFCGAGSGALLYINPHFNFIGMLFYLFLTIAVWRIGIRCGSYLKAHKHEPLMTYSVILGALIILFLALFSINVPSVQFTKDGLKQTYKSITGSDPTAQEKSSFWKENTGQEAPSDQKKNEFWGNQGKK